MRRRHPEYFSSYFLYFVCVAYHSSSSCLSCASMCVTLERAVCPASYSHILIWSIPLFQQLIVKKKKNASGLNMRAYWLYQFLRAWFVPVFHVTLLETPYFTPIRKSAFSIFLKTIDTVFSSSLMSFRCVVMLMFVLSFQLFPLCLVLSPWPLFSLQTVFCKCI